MKGTRDSIIVRQIQSRVVTFTMEEPHICVEVGVTASQVVPLKMKDEKYVYLPDKLGELLAGMYTTATLSHLNSNIQNFQSSIMWTVFGILIIRGCGVGVGVVGVTMTLSNEECYVHINVNDFVLRQEKLEQYFSFYVAKIDSPQS